MPIEDDQNDDTTQQNDTTQQQNDQSQDTGQNQRVDTRDDNDKRLDGMLDAFMESTDAPAKTGKTATDQDKTKQSANREQQQDSDTTTQQRRQSDGTARTVQQVPQAARKFGSLFSATATGDIVDAQGQVIAKQGYGRSIFHKLYPHIEHFQRENASLKSTVTNYESATKLAKDAGLSLDEQGAGMQLMVQWKKDPVKTINTLLTLAEQNGKDVASIRQGGGGVDVTAIMSRIEEALDSRMTRFDPLLAGIQQQREEAELRETVDTRYNAFIEQYPDATPHIEALGSIMRDRQVSETEAYFALRAFAAENGLDFKKDLKPQILARQKQPNGQRNPSGGGNDRDLPDMNGRSNATGDTVRAGSRSIADPDESYDSITRRVFEKHGMKVQ